MKGKHDWDQHWSGKKVIIDRYTRDAYSSFSDMIRGPKVLEVGSGTGRFAYLLSGRAKTVVAVDSSLNALRISKNFFEKMGVENVYCVLANGFNLPFRDAEFDSVLNEGVIIYFKNYDDMFKEIARVTKKRLVTCVPNWGNLFFTMYKKFRGEKFEYGWEKSFRPQELSEMYRKFGFENIKIRGYSPEHSIRRLGRFPVSIITILISEMLSVLVSALDKISKKYVSDRFGFYICAGGDKN